MLTSLREEGAEPLIWVCGFSLFREVSIRLVVTDALVAVDRMTKETRNGCLDYVVPGYHAPSSRANVLD